MRAPALQPSIASFDPTTFTSFRLIGREHDGEGNVRLRYGLDQLEFEERVTLPPPADRGRFQQRSFEGLLDLLHWVAGVSYYKAAIPQRVAFERATPGPAALALLEALYGEGLGEFAVVNRLPGLPHPEFLVEREPLSAPLHPRPPAPAGAPTEADAPPLERLLVPVGGGKDSAVAIEIARASGLPTTLFSVGDARPIRETAAVSGYERLVASRTIDQRLLDANAAGALNGHVPVTAIVSCLALLTAALHGHDAVALANERSASSGNLLWNGVEVNHQFSKSLRAERLFNAALREIPGAPRAFSLLRPASELSIARAFARHPRYHPVFTSCNRIFHIDPARRTSSWCCDCDKCRFVFLILAPFLEPARMVAIFGRDLLAEPEQYDGFALLAATGADKPFECVGEVDECRAAIRLLHEHQRWRDHPVVRRLVAEVLGDRPVADADLERHLTLSAEHEVPDELIGAVRAVLAA